MNSGSQSRAQDPGGNNLIGNAGETHLPIVFYQCIGNFGDRQRPDRPRLS